MLFVFRSHGMRMKLLYYLLLRYHRTAVVANNGKVELIGYLKWFAGNIPRDPVNFQTMLSGCSHFV